MFCNKCGKKLSDTATFCTGCGNRIKSSQQNKKENNDIESIFQRGCGIWSGELNNSDIFVNPNTSISSSFRQNFGLSFDDKVLFCRDTSFWNEKNQGVVVTNNGVYCNPNNSDYSQSFNFKWSDIDRVEYKDQVLYFFLPDNRYWNIHISFFCKNSNNSSVCDRIGVTLAGMFTGMSKCRAYVNEHNEAWNEFYNLFNAGNLNDAISLARNYMNNNSDGIDFYIPMADAYYKSGNYDATIDICNEALDRIDENNSELLTKMRYIGYLALREDGNIINARTNALQVWNDSDYNMSFYNGQNMKNDSKNDFFNLDDLYIKNFLELPYQERKILVPVNDYSFLGQDYICVAALSKIQDLGKVSFPVGHPIAYETYIGHPFIHGKYIPIENYEYELAQDRIDEFCYLAQCLGATSIEIAFNGSINSNENRNGNINIKGNYNNKIAGQTNNNITTQEAKNFQKRIEKRQVFETPVNQPYIPDGLVWYNQEASWQRLAKQRLEGNILEHHEVIDTSKNRCVESNELSNISAELEFLFHSANMEYNKEQQTKLIQNESISLTIEIQFCNKQAISSQCQYSSDELEYIENVKDFLSDGIIGERERRFLNRLREKLRISEHRAMELESLLEIPALSEEEQEYYDEYKSCIEDGGITDKERRLLDKLKLMLNISDERSKEIESMV